MVTGALLICLLTACWLLLRGGGSPLAIEGLLVFSAWGGMSLGNLLGYEPSSAGVILVGALAGALVAFIYYLAQGKKNNRFIRVIVLNVGATAILVGEGSSFILSPYYQMPFLVILVGLFSPLLVYLVLAHSRLGLLIRSAGGASDLLRRLGHRVWLIQAMTFACAGALVGIIAAAKGGTPSGVVGYGYLAYFILVMFRYLLNIALKSLNEA